MKIINMSVNDIKIYLTEKFFINFPSAGVINIIEGIVSRSTINLNSIYIKINNINIKGTTKLPRKSKNIFYIVTKDIAMLCKRDDFIYPSEPYYNSDGIIIGYKCFERVI
jgi:hypothetical protein